ncbi:hypothetical protein PMAYCL1PPCAC_04403, partial [Pristionchus mayeri]
MTCEYELLSSLDGFRKKASEYARHDRIGYVFARSFDLIGGAVKDGLEAESVRELNEFLEHDREFVMSKDSKDLVPLVHAPRDLVYDLIKALGSMFDILISNRSQNTIKEQVDAHYDEADDSLHEPLTNESNYVIPRDIHNLMPLDDIVKCEVMDPLDEMNFDIFPKEEEVIKRCRVSLPRRSYMEDSVDSCPSTTSTATPSVQRTRGKPKHWLHTKNFTCDDCDFAADSYNKLAIHKNSHTGERPFKCSVDNCEMKFTSKGNLDRHLKNFHKQCRTCEKTFLTV